MAVDANEFVEVIKRAAIEAVEATKPVNVYFGEVVSVSPLKINVEQKMELGEKQLIFSRNVTTHSLILTVEWETESHEVRHNHAGDSGDTTYAEVPHTHKIKAEQKLVMVHNGLAVGDEVILIRQQGGQKFVVIDRIGGGE